ncbi:Uncharacterised protein [Chlamydia abortus]|nr:Uncharacterised protein [Chlamydia abortus]
MFLIFHDFEFNAIFHVLQWTFLNIPPLSGFPRHISRPKVFPPFSIFLAIFHVLKCLFSFSVHFSFFTFFCDFVIFQVVKWMFLIFQDFQFSWHIQRPTVDVSKFSTLFSFPRHISGHF